MNRIQSFVLRGAASVALLALLAACGHSGSASSQPVQQETVKGVATPSQISVVTAK